MDTLLVSNLGVGLGFLVILFLGLATGRIFTRKSVDMILKTQNDYIKTLERTNDKLEERNDLLESRLDNMIEVARAHGMIAALPRAIGERIIE